MKLAVVTGASGGIGGAIVSQLKNDGYKVVGLVHKKNDNCCCDEIVCDLSKLDVISNIYDAIVDKYGVPNYLVNNAGVYYAKPWDEISIDEFTNSMNVNSIAPFLLSKYFAKYLIKNNESGAIVNVGSVSGQIGSVDPSYAASKAGLNGITKSLVKSLSQYNIRVNTVAPGPVDTKMGDNIPDEVKDKYKAGIPMKRFGNPEEIANLVCYLLSDKASYMSGAIVDINGGLV